MMEYCPGRMKLSAINAHCRNKPAYSFKGEK